MSFRQYRIVLSRLLVTGGLLCAPAWGQLVQRGGKIAGTGASRLDAARQGSAAALSVDGTTAIEGGPYDGGGRGAVWVFTRSGSGWSQQGEKLTAADAVGERVFLGRSAALSADGNTALVGGDGDNEGVGAAWVFTRTDGVWTEQVKLIGSGGMGKSGQRQSGQGSAVALSADGNTALIGGMSDGEGIGAAWVFTRANAAWTEQANLIGRGAAGKSVQGSAVSLSANGNTALIGGSTDDQNRGAVWIFTRSGEAWTQQGGKLVGSGGNPGATSDGSVAVHQGFSAALSGDGNTAVVGGYGDDRNTGAAWVFARSGDVWTQQGEKLTAPGAAGAQIGYSVALSNDGSRLLLGGPDDDGGAGAAWEVRRVNGVWTQAGKLVSKGASGNARQGYAVTISGDGHTALLGGILDGAAGGLWTFADPILAISAPVVATAGVPVTITVTAQDNSGNTVRYAGTLHFTSSDAQADLPADAALIEGTGVFSVTLKTSGPQTIAASDTVVAISATSPPVPVNAGPAVRFQIEAPDSASTGQEVAVTVVAVDPFNNPVEYKGGIHWTSSDPRAVLPGDSRLGSRQRPLSGAAFSRTASGATPGRFTIKFGTPGEHNLTVTGTLAASLSGSVVIHLKGGQNTDYVSVVLSTNPIAYFRLEAADDTSKVNGYTSTFQGGASLATPGAPICEPNNHNVSLNGATSSIVNTSLSGGVTTAGSIAAWVNLAALPSAFNRLLYVAGESHVGNDFDLQFTTDNFVRFYVSDDGINVGYQPNVATLVGQWHWIVATFDSSTNTENLYWDGKLVATANNTVFTNKTGQFAIGASNVFTGRNFDGGIDEVAVWNTALTAAQVSAIYGSSVCPVFINVPATITTTAIVNLLLGLLIPVNANVTVTASVNLQLNPLPQEVTVNVNPPGAGTVTGGGLIASGATATITATPNPNYVFANFSGSVPTTSANPLIVTVTGPLTIVANFTPLEPVLRAAVTGARTDGPVPGTRIVPVTITNAGQGAALNAQISSVTTTVLSGGLSFRVTLASGVPSAPVTLAPGASITLPLVFDWPLSASRVSMKFELSATDARDNSYSATQTVTLFR